MGSNDLLAELFKIFLGNAASLHDPLEFSFRII